MIHDPCGLPQLAGQGSSIPGGEGGASGAWLFPSATPQPQPQPQPTRTNPDRRLHSSIGSSTSFPGASPRKAINAAASFLRIEGKHTKASLALPSLTIHNPYWRLSRRGIEFQWFPAVCLARMALISRYCVQHTAVRIRRSTCLQKPFLQLPGCGTGYSTARACLRGTAPRNFRVRHGCTFCCALQAA